MDDESGDEDTGNNKFDHQIFIPDEIEMTNKREYQKRIPSQQDRLHNFVTV